MSHMILEHDAVVALEPCWHGLERIESEINLENSGLNWGVTQSPLFTADMQEIKGFRAVHREDKPEVVMNVSKESYAIIQNSRLFEVIDNALTGVDYKIATTGSLGNCAKVFISVLLSDHQEYVTNKEKFFNYLTFCTSHDGSMAFEVYDTSTRVVCQNTMAWSRAGAKNFKMKTRHTKNNEIKIQDMEKTLEELFQKREEFYQTYAGLCSRALSVKEAEQILASFVTPEESEEMSTRAYNQSQEILNLFKNGKGNSGDTFGSLLNGATEYFTHHSSNNIKKQFATSEFGSGAKKKIEFWNLINSEAGIKDAKVRGKNLLATV